jgi:hypothetical protein
MKTIWRKLYTKVKENDHGMYHEAIIVYQKEPLLFKSVDQKLDDDVLDNIRSGGVFTARKNVFTAQYKYHLRIDLWIVVLEFHWKGRIREEKEKPFFDVMKGHRENLLKILSKRIKEDKITFITKR